ncbi:MAG: response regulator [bacterium]|nr:response regulator [bacterium]
MIFNSGIRLVSLVWLIVISSGTYSQNRKTLNFNQITQQEGLSSTDITSIVQDKDGFMWVGTEDGLNRYDGYSFTVFKNDPNNEFSIADNKITTLHVDNSGSLWIGTENNGLSRYIEHKDQFQNYKFDIYDNHSINFSHVTSIAEDSQGNLWVGTLMGLNLYDKEKDHFNRYFYERVIHFDHSADSLASQLSFSETSRNKILKLIDTAFVSESWLKKYLEINVPEINGKNYEQFVSISEIGNFGRGVRSILGVSNGFLWLGMENEGLIYFHKEYGIVDQFTTNNSGLLSNEIASFVEQNEILWIGTRSAGLHKMHLGTREIKPFEIGWANPHIKCLFVDNKNNFWLGNDYGLGLFDQSQQSFLRYGLNSNAGNGLLSETVTSIFQDNHENLWVGSYQGGINLLINSQPFIHYRHDEENSILTKNRVSSLLEDSEGNIWVGYYTTGVDRVSDSSSSFLNANYNSKDGLGMGSVFCLFEDSGNNIWAGTYEGGLQRYDKEKDDFFPFHKELTNKDVRSIDEDSLGNLWIAVHGDGIYNLNRKDNSVIKYNPRYPDLTQSLASDWVHSVLVDSKSRIWVGSVNGISLLLPGISDFISFDVNNSSLSHNNVRILHEDDTGLIWIGTDNGLNYFDHSVEDFKVVDESSFPNNTIKGIESDDAGNLWISSNLGLTRYNPSTGSAKSFTQQDGLQSNEFFSGASTMGSKGNLFFGGKNGFNQFSPNKIKSNEYTPPVVLTDFYLFNEKISPSDSSEILVKPLRHTQFLELEYDQNFFTIKFAALNFTNSQNNQYQYILENFNDSWNNIGSRREATFTNVPPGEYKFTVKAANNDGLWNETGTSLLITIRPPFWKTGIAYFFYSVIIVIGSVLLRRMVLNRIYLKNQLALDELKLNFFANISHEFRTPLTLILGPLQELTSLVSKKETKKHELMDLMQRNADRLLRLVNQIMDIYQIDAGFSKLKIREEDLRTLVTNVFNVFTFKAEQKNMHYYLFVETNLKQVYVDRDKFEKITSNLISNALKFTPVHGAVMVFVEVEEKVLGNGQLKDFLKIRVEDSGFGIADDAQKNIFKRFHLNNKQETDEPGTGIGLSLVAQLIQVHRGIIQVESEIMDGSRFTVWLPINRADYLVEEVEPTEITEIESKPASEVNRPTEYEVLNPNFPLVLVIDDSEDIRKYLRYNLSNDYRVLEAANGREGIDLAFEEIPDVIISDVMMPGINGMEVCRILKGDQRTSHIPLILLTARASVDYHIKGLETGADDYISKPFNLDILRARLKNQLLRIQDLKNRFEPSIPIPKQLMENEQDQVFLKKLYEIIEDNLSNTDLRPEVLANEIGMSRSVMYRKIQAVTGSSASIIVRQYRLNRAAQMLKSKLIPIKELAFQVGFKDAAYFTACFKKSFNMSPKQFAEQGTVTE